MQTTVAPFTLRYYVRSCPLVHLQKNRGGNQAGVRTCFAGNPAAEAG